MLITRTPAPTWEAGLITGSGRVGALVHGAPDRLVVSLAHERFFLPANPRPSAPDLRASLSGMRQRLLEGDAPAAASLFSSSAHDSGFRDLVWTDPLGMCATLVISTEGGAADARRTIDPERGIVGVEWSDDAGHAHRVRLVAPRGHDTVWIAIESAITTRVGLTLSLSADDDGPAPSFAPDYRGAVRWRAHPGPPALLEVLDRHGQVLVTTSVSGRWQAEGDGAVTSLASVQAGVPRMLRLDVAPRGLEARRAPQAEWPAIATVQTKAHRDLVRTSTLCLHGVGDGPVEAVWAHAREEDEAALRRAVELAYTSGRSHIIASTGELPPTLQGVWQGTWQPAWSADYTLNGNVQNGALAAVIPTGTPELARSLLELVLPHLDDYRANAERVFGAEGMLLPSRMSTHGAADHFNADFPHVFWTGCGGWTLRFAADLVSTTGDRSVVDDRLWALVEGVLRFGETALVERNGFSRFVPSYSPENTPLGATTPLATDSTMDVAILRDAARAAAVLAAARGDRSLDARWAALTARLPGYRVAEDGTLAEWIDTAWSENIAHRHVSQLYPLWYEPDPAFTGKTSDAVALRAAARETVRRKLAWRAEDPGPPPGHGEMAFGLVQLGLAAASLGDSASALECVHALVLDHWQPTLTTTHDAGRIFNLDASGGLPAVVAAMLVGSAVGEVTVLPALPPQWPSGEVTGIRARGGVIVERLRWDAEGCDLTLRAVPAARWLNPGGQVRVRAGRPFELRDGGPPELVLTGTASVRLRWTESEPSLPPPGASHVRSSR